MPRGVVQIAGDPGRPRLRPGAARARRPLGLGARVPRARETVAPLADAVSDDPGAAPDEGSEQQRHGRERVLGHPDGARVDDEEADHDAARRPARTRVRSGLRARRYRAIVGPSGGPAGSRSRSAAPPPRSRRRPPAARRQATRGREASAASSTPSASSSRVSAPESRVRRGARAKRRRPRCREPRPVAPRARGHAALVVQTSLSCHLEPRGSEGTAHRPPRGRMLRPPGEDVEFLPRSVSERGVRGLPWLHEHNPDRPPALVTHELTKRYGGRAAVDNLSIEVPAGVVAGFIGPNGAGKTTTMAMLLAASSGPRPEAQRSSARASTTRPLPRPRRRADRDARVLARAHRHREPPRVGNARRTRRTPHPRASSSSPASASRPRQVW